MQWYPQTLPMQDASHQGTHPHIDKQLSRHYQHSHPTQTLFNTHRRRRRRIDNRCIKFLKVKKGVNKNKTSGHIFFLQINILSIKNSIEKAKEEHPPDKNKRDRQSRNSTHEEGGKTHEAMQSGVSLLFFLRGLTVLRYVLHYFSHTIMRTSMATVSMAIENTEEGDMGLISDWPNTTCSILIML